MSGHKTRSALWVALAVAAAMPASFVQPVAAEEFVNTGYFGDVAIKGYDPVAYFTQHQAVEGKRAVFPPLAGCDLAFCQRGKPRPLQGRAGKIRTAIWRLLR